MPFSPSKSLSKTTKTPQTPKGHKSVIIFRYFCTKNSQKNEAIFFNNILACCHRCNKFTFREPNGKLWFGTLFGNYDASRCSFCQIFWRFHILQKPQTWNSRNDIPFVDYPSSLCTFPFFSPASISMEIRYLKQ